MQENTPGAAPSRPSRDGSSAELFEAVLTSLCSTTLDLPDVPRERSLMELGADSISVMRLLGRIRSVLQVELPLEIVFEGASIARLAAEIARCKNSAGADAPAPARLETH